MFFVGGGAMIDLMTTTQAVRDAAYEYLPWAAAAPLFGFACFQLDGIFIGATRTADMRNMMIVALAIYLAAWAVLMPAYGNHGLWASLMVFFAARALTLGARFPALARAVASDEPRASSEATART
jgi:MATE family multidrug resistance protein